jgi:cell division protein FtsL
MARAATARAATPRTRPAGARTAAARARPAPARPAQPARRPPRRASGRTRAAAAPRAAALPRGARVLDALLTGRAWIALVGVLLAGIVFFNVDLLQMNREITQMADRAAQIKRENDRLRHDYARLASSERIQEAAAALGLVYPAAGEVRYLESKPKLDAHNASKRIVAPNLAYVAPEPATTPEPTLTTPVPPQ